MDEVTEAIRAFEARLGTMLDHLERDYSVQLQRIDVAKVRQSANGPTHYQCKAVTK